MGRFQPKRLRADALFSDHIRGKANWKCERCQKVCRVDGVWIAKLDASHYFVRSKWNTRFDEDNVHALCFNCHERMGEYKNNEDGEYDIWMKEILGEEKYKNLKLRSNFTAARDPKLWLIYVKQLIKNNEPTKSS